MKNIKYLFIVLLTALLIIPVGVFAEGEENTNARDGEVVEESKEVSVYFFRGDGCSHCAEAEAWFESIEAEYGSKYEIKDYETWYNEDNAELMSKVAASRGEEDQVTGVPYILVGDQSWIGFDESYKAEILDKINSMYDQDVSERHDALASVDMAAKEEKNVGNDIFSLIVILLICGGAGYGIYYARKKTN